MNLSKEEIELEFLGKESLDRKSDKENEIQSITTLKYHVAVTFPYLSREGKHSELQCIDCSVHR